MLHFIQYNYITHTPPPKKKGKGGGGGGEEYENTALY